MYFHFSILILWICSLNLASSTNSTECSTHTSCRSCISSSCYWCVGEQHCTSNSAYHCLDTVIPVGLSVDVCPSIVKQIPEPSIGEPSEILIPAGTNKTVQVEVNIAGQLMAQSRFICQFNIEGRVTKVNAALIGNVINCDSVEFDYSQNGVGTSNVTFDVIWGDSKVLENPNNMRVVIYRCPDMAGNCSTCTDVKYRYRCGWCLFTHKCVVSSQCNYGPGEWLDDYDICSKPFIRNFSPQMGPHDGGTNVTIQGFNLGNTFEDVLGHIAVAGIACEPYRHLYVPGKEIVCLVSHSTQKRFRPGPVTLKMGTDNEAESKEKFTFVDPTIEDIFPNHGPLAGGTELSIKGKHLDGAGQIEVFLSKLPCKIVSINSTEIKCITTASNKPLNGNVTVTFDQAIRSHKKEFFVYSDCRAHTSCVSCVTSSISCDWCVNGHTCRHDEVPNCPSDPSVIGVNLDDLGGHFQKGPKFCPKINGTSDGSSEILIPAGTKKSIQVKTEILSMDILQTRFVCQFNIEGRVTSVNAQILGNVAYCDSMEFGYTQPGPNTTAVLDVIWGGTKSLDNPGDVHVVVYKCNEMAKTINECSTLEAKYKCGWCQSTNSCEFNDQCKKT